MRRAVRAVLFLLPVFFLFPNASAVPFGRSAEFSDLLVSHYPNALFLQRTLFGNGVVPLWSASILSGTPFAANPLSNLFYPPAWISLLFPLPLGINVMVIAHLLWGGVGMYLLLREEGISEIGSMFGALTFEAMPKLFSHLAAGHITLIYAVAWTPWLLFAERRFSAAKNARWLIPGFVLGIIALADIRWAAYSGLIWLAYSGWGHLITIRTRLTDVRKHVIWIARVSLKVLLAAAVAAPLLLPLMEYTRISTRSLLTAADIQYLSLPFGNLLGVLYPAIGGASEWILYTGAATLALSIFSAIETDARRRAAFWLVLIPLTVIFALGSNIPWLSFLTTLPGMSLLRVPPRILFLTGMCFSAAAAYGLDTLAAGRNPNAEKERDRPLLFLFALATFSVMLAVGAWVVLRDPQQQLARIQFLWGAAFLALSVGVIFARRTNRLANSRAATALFVLVLVDVTCINGLSLEYRSLEETIMPSRSTAVFLQEASEGEPYRVYSPSYSLPQHAAAWYEIELADGVDPLQMAAYSRYMETASGVPTVGYSVTLPSFKDGNPSEDNRGYIPDARLLGLLNVRYVVSAFPLGSENLELLRQEDQTWIYQNRLALPRVWVQEPDASIGTRLTDTPNVDLRPNHIVVTADGPGLLVLSELAYPGWEVSVDGRRGQIRTVEGILRGVLLEAGSHEVVFTFRPRMVIYGLLLALLALASWAWLLRKNRGDGMMDQVNTSDDTSSGGTLTLKQMLRPYWVLLAGPVLLLGPLLLRGEVTFWGTPSLQFVPWWQYALDSLRQGVLPLWNPLNGMGGPLMANYQTAFFYPPNWLLLVFGLAGGAGGSAGGSAAGIAVGFVVLSILHLAWAGLGMALLLRELRFGWLGQVIGGLAFGLSGYTVARLGFFVMVWAAAWLPWVILYAERIAGGFSKQEPIRARIPAWLMLAACLTMQLLSGHAQLTWYSIMLAGLWIIVSGWRAGGWRKALQSALKLGGALIAAAAAAAVQLIPTFEYLRQSQRADAVDLEVALTYSFWPWRLLTIFAPDLFGNPASGDFWGYASYWEDHLYIGMLPALLVIASLILLIKDIARRRKGVRTGLRVFLWLGLIVTFILAMGRYTPLFPFLYHNVPTFDMFQAPARYLLWAAFAFPVLAAAAAERWRSPTGRGLYWFRLGTAGAFAVTLGAGAAWIGMQGIQPTFIRAAALAGLWALGFGLLTLAIPWAQKTGRERHWRWAVIVWVLADLLFTGWPLNPGTSLNYYAGEVMQPPVQEGERIFLSKQEEDDLKFKRFLRFDDFRRLEDWRTMRAMFIPNSNLLEGTAVVYNFDPLVPEGYARWKDAIETTSLEARPSWLRWVGVGAVERIDLSQPDGIRFDRVDGASRWRWVSCIRSVENWDAAWQALEDEMQVPLQANRAMILEEQAVAQGSASEDGCQHEQAEIVLTLERPNRLEFLVETPADGWLQIMDTWYPGWYAAVDGEPIPVLRADGNFRAVKVPAGNHTIVIHYRPLGFIFGGLFSILVLLLTILWYIFSGRSKGFVRPIQSVEQSHRRFLWKQS